MSKNAQSKLSYIGRKAPVEYVRELETESRIQGFLPKVQFFDGTSQDKQNWTDRKKSYYDGSNVCVRYVGPVPIAKRLRSGQAVAEVIQAEQLPDGSHIPDTLRLVLGEPILNKPKISKQRNIGKIAMFLPIKTAYDIYTQFGEYDISAESSIVCDAQGIKHAGEPKLYVGSLYFPESHNIEDSLQAATRIARVFRSMSTDMTVSELGRFDLE